MPTTTINFSILFDVQGLFNVYPQFVLPRLCWWTEWTHWKRDQCFVTYLFRRLYLPRYLYWQRHYQNSLSWFQTNQILNFWFGDQCLPLQIEELYQSLARNLSFRRNRYSRRYDLVIPNKFDDRMITNHSWILQKTSTSMSFCWPTVMLWVWDASPSIIVKYRYGITPPYVSPIQATQANRVGRRLTQS